MAQLSVEDISIEREIYKGCGYRLHAANMSGKIIAMKVYEGNRAHEVCFRMMDHIHPDCFVEAMLGSCQIQLQSYIWCMVSAFIFNYDLELMVRLPVTQISHRWLEFLLSNPTFLILSSMEVRRKMSAVASFTQYDSEQTMKVLSTISLVRLSRRISRKLWL